jgi:hypothetical protein
MIDANTATTGHDRRRVTGPIALEGDSGGAMGGLVKPPFYRSREVARRIATAAVRADTRRGLRVDRPRGRFRSSAPARWHNKIRRHTQ